MPTAGELARENPKSLGALCSAGTRGPQSHKSQASRSLMGRLSLRARSVLKSHQYKCALFWADMLSIKFKCNSNSGGEFVGWGARAGQRADRDSQL